MRQLNNYSSENRLLIFRIWIVLLLALSCSCKLSAQNPTVIIKQAFAVKDTLVYRLEIKRIKSQNMTLEFIAMISGETKRISIPKTEIVEQNGNCLVSGKVNFPPGDTKITIYNDQNLPLCNGRRQNTKENALKYDPSKGQ